MEHQVVEWELPPAPTKSTDTRSDAWNGLGQVELDAVMPEQIVDLCNDAIGELFDDELYDELIEQQKEEKIEYKRLVKEIVKKL